MLEALMNYEFPGNVRELEHIIEESVIFSKGETLQLHRPLKFAPDSPIASPLANNSSNKSLAEIEREYILATLKQTGGRIRGADGAAEILQIKPTTLEARMKKLGIKKLHANISPEI
jgi:formate hydrogenlyase transcriptional activator